MPVIKHASLRDYSYYSTGGACSELYLPESLAELGSVVKELTRRGKPYFLLGGGSNSLVSDEPFPGAVIVFKNLADIKIAGKTLTVGAGAENSAVVKQAAAAHLAGIGWMYRLPGQIGGTVRMNARCYGGEISQVVSRIVCISREGKTLTYTDPAVFKGYKDTIFMRNGDLIAEVDLALAPGDEQEILRLMNHCENDRVAKGQFDFPSCGCVFKNDYNVGISSGMLLEAAGAKALKVGGAEVSPYHANFVYNKGATSRDILELSFLMQERVYAAFGVWLEYEMEVLGILAADLGQRLRLQRPSSQNEGALAPLREKMKRAMSR